MPVALEPLATPEPALPPAKSWTREECQALERAGFIHPGRYELIEGHLIEKIGKLQPHNRSVWLMVEWLRSIFGARFVAQESSIDLRPEDNPTSDPEPDAIVLNVPFPELPARARPEHLRMVVEIADRTLNFDLGPKARLYARSKIPEYWVLDITGRRLVVHRNPSDGVYTAIHAFSAGESVSPIGVAAFAVRPEQLV